MAESSIFWPTGTTGDGASTYTDTQLFSWLRRTFNSDLYADRGPLVGYGGELAVTGTTSPVSVATGAAYVYGIPYENDAVVTVAIPTPVSATRVDRIVLRADWTAKTVRITRLAGTEGAGAPAITQSPGSVYDVKLAQVMITTGGVITVTDERQFCRFATRIATENIEDGAITAAKISGGAVGTSMLADGAVTSAKIADGTIIDVDISAIAGIAQSKISNATRTIDADMVDGAHAGTNANNVLLLDASGNATPSGYVTSAGRRTIRTNLSQNLLLQYGSGTIPSGVDYLDITFNVAYFSAPSVVATMEPDRDHFYVTNVTTTGFRAQTGGSNATPADFRWIAVGPAT